RTSSSSGVAERGVAARRTAVRLPFRNEPIVTFELPTSIASSTARSYAARFGPPRSPKSDRSPQTPARYYRSQPLPPECPRRTRPRQLSVYPLAQGAESVVVDFTPGRDGTSSPFEPRQLAFDTSGYVQMELQGLDSTSSAEE